MSALEARERSGALCFCSHTVQSARRFFFLSLDELRFFSLPLNMKTDSMVFALLFCQVHVEVESICLRLSEFVAFLGEKAGLGLEFTFCQVTAMLALFLKFASHLFTS